MIKNFDDLATTPLRQDGLAILEAGYQAILTAGVVKRNISLEGDILHLKDDAVDLSQFSRVFFVAIGKCALDTAVAIEDIMADKITAGIALDVREGLLHKIKSIAGTHPLPSAKNVQATKEIVAMLTSLTEKDLVLAFISGGGSALLFAPLSLSVEDMVRLTQYAMDKGVTIAELNILRKHLSSVKGGQLAKLMFPATVYSLIFSDVPGDDVSSVASGPTVLDISTKSDAEAIIAKYQVFDVLNWPGFELMETPKEQKYFAKVKNVLFLTNANALEAMKAQATKLGYQTIVKDSKLEGNDIVVGHQFSAAPLEAKTCELYGGELTAEVKVPGKGGRAQEMVLAALDDLKDERLVIGAASDGWDNTEVAGALGDQVVLAQATELNLSPEEYLNQNRSYEFFEKTGSQIVTGRTGANVADFYMIIKN